MFGETRQFDAVVCLDLLPTVCGLLRPRATPWACRRTGGPPETFLTITRSGRRGPQPGAARTGCSLVTQEGEQGRAGCYQRPRGVCRASTRSPSRCGSSVTAKPDQRRTLVTRRAYPDHQRIIDDG
jgi:hypothetical protein